MGDEVETNHVYEHWCVHKVGIDVACWAWTANAVSAWTSITHKEAETCVPVSFLCISFYIVFNHEY